MIVMIYQSGIFKEIILPNTDNTDYSIYIDRHRFEVKKSFYLWFEVINHQWYIRSSEEYTIDSGHEYGRKAVLLTDNDIVKVSTAKGDRLSIIPISKTLSLLSAEKYLFGNHSCITIGKDTSNDICYTFLRLVSKRHCAIVREGRHFFIEDYSSNGVFVNFRRVNQKRELQFGDIIEIFGLRIGFFEYLISVSSMAGNYCVSDNLKQYHTDNGITKQVMSLSGHTEVCFNRSPRIIPRIIQEKIVIEPPSAPKFTKKRSLLSTIGPSFTMALPMMLGTGIAIFSSARSGYAHSAFMYTGIITAVGSAVFGAMWAFINLRETKRQEMEEENQRFNTYGNYLLQMSEYIKEIYTANRNALYQLYPSAEECCLYDSRFSELWSKNYSHSDFLFCRLGTGDIDFQTDIVIPTEKFSMTYDSLKDKPQMLYENFRILREVPVGVDFAQKNIYGIAGGKNKKGVYDIVNTIIAQISAMNCYTDVKIVFCYDEKKLVNKDQWKYIKWLPHVWSENKSMRYFATNRQETADVFFEIANIMRNRSESLSDSCQHKRILPHYMLFVSDADMLNGEILSRYVFDTAHRFGLTTFIFTDYYYNLPNVCENIIQNDQSFCGYYNVYNNSENYTNINFDRVSYDSLMHFSKTLANITVKEMQDNNAIVSSLDFFEMYGIHTLDQLNIRERWLKNRTYLSMKALVGKKAGGADCYLDINEKYHGPHGLVAGTTGSGKSELMQTFILSLAINYSPEDVAFFIIDFKGGGMANLFSDLPHIAGQISNLSGNQVERAMISIKSENLRRQRMFSEYGVNKIDDYTKLYKSGEASEPIPHLLIIIDEFAELKREKKEFMMELISVAQVGRSLGVHLILATQKPSGTVDDNIWSNAKFRMCLRVQDRQDSNDMLHKPDAAYITQAGRCYLQVGNDEIYELFQSGWSGAVYEEKADIRTNETATMILPTGKTAVVGSHTKMKRKEAEKFHWYKFLVECVMNTVVSVEKQGDENTLPCQMIQKAREANYNIGFSSSEIHTMETFIGLVPKEVRDIEKTVKDIIAYASVRKIKLPETKEKTQLEAVVEYISDFARKNGYTKKSELWTPLLKTEIPLEEIEEYQPLFDGEMWHNPEKWELETIIGMYDDPQNQTQLAMKVDFVEGGHTVVCGSVVSGKSTFLQTLIFSLANRYSPDYLHFYVMDFSGGMLSVFECLPHCGGVLKENDMDKIDKLFNMIKTMVNERKKLFHGGSYSQYVKVHGMVLPSVFIVIDNFAGFKEKTANAYEDILIYLSREGISYGIYLVFSSAGFGMAEIQNRIGDNIRTVISLEMSDKFKYMELLRVSKIPVMPETGVKGRGIAVIDGRILEFQTALSLKADDDYQRNQQIKNICTCMKAVWKGKTAKPIPFIPENPVFSEFSQLEEYQKMVNIPCCIPFAYDAESASVYSIRLQYIYCYTISGKRRTGKTNLLKLIMTVAKAKPSTVVVIENEGDELKGTAESLKFSYLQSDSEIFAYFKELTPEFIRRNKLKKEYEAEGMSEFEIYEKMTECHPIFIFLGDIDAFVKSVYHPSDGVGNMSGFFENILEKGSLHNIYFFGCTDTDNYAMMSSYKAYRQYISYKRGVHLGGNVQQQRIYNFQNIHYKQISKVTKKGIGLTPEYEDEDMAKSIVIPLLGGKTS